MVLEVFILREHWIVLNPKVGGWIRLGLNTVALQQLGHLLPNNKLKCNSKLGSPENNILKLGIFKK